MTERLPSFSDFIRKIKYSALEVEDVPVEITDLFFLSRPLPTRVVLLPKPEDEDIDDIPIIESEKDAIPSWLSIYTSFDRLSDSEKQILKIMSKKESYMYPMKKRFYFVLCDHLINISIGSKRGRPETVFEDISLKLIEYGADEEEKSVENFFRTNFYQPKSSNWLSTFPTLILKEPDYVLPLILEDGISTRDADFSPPEWFYPCIGRIKITKTIQRFLFLMKRPGKMTLEMKRYLVSTVDVVSRIPNGTKWYATEIFKHVAKNLELFGVIPNFPFVTQILINITFPCAETFYDKINIILFSDGVIIPPWIKDYSHLLKPGDEIFFDPITPSTRSSHEEKRILFQIVRFIKENKTWNYVEIFYGSRDIFEQLDCDVSEKIIKEAVYKLRFVKTDMNEKLWSLMEF